MTALAEALIMAVDIDMEEELCDECGHVKDACACRWCNRCQYAHVPPACDEHEPDGGVSWGGEAGRTR